MSGLAEPCLPRTEAVRRVLRGTNNPAMESDLLFLEAWELWRTRDLGTTLRASQIRRANPALAAEIQAELKQPRPDRPTPPAKG